MTEKEMMAQTVDFDQIFVGKKLESVVSDGEGVRFTFEGGGYRWWRHSIPVNEHKLALLEKALELSCRPSWGDPEDADATYWIEKAVEALKDPVKWKIEDHIVWPQWVLDRENPPSVV